MRQLLISTTTTKCSITSPINIVFLQNRQFIQTHPIIRGERDVNEIKQSSYM